MDRDQLVQAQSQGARLISAMVLGPSRLTEFIAATEAAEIAKVHDERVRFLVSYLFGANCNGECKGKLVDFMLTFYAEAQGRFDQALRELLGHPHAEVSTALARIHSRLLSCQVDDDDERDLIDRVLVPSLAQELQKPHWDTERVEDLLSLLALSPDPGVNDDDPNTQAARKAWQGALEKVHSAAADSFRHAFVARRAAAQTTRSKPSPAARRVMFCSAAEVPPSEFDIDDE